MECDERGAVRELRRLIIIGKKRRSPWDHVAEMGWGAVRSEVKSFQVGLSEDVLPHMIEFNHTA